MFKTTRRDVLKVGAAGLVGAAAHADTHLPMGEDGSGVQDAAESAGLKLAGYPFEHVRGLMDGHLQLDGFGVEFQTARIGDLNTHLFSGPRTLDISEVGLLPYILAFANEDFREYPLIPVFPLRMFRHRSIFIHTDRGIDSPEDLKGRRIGTPGYSSTSLTWIRGMVKDEYGVDPTDIQWVISAEDSSGAASGAISQQEQVVPEGISIVTGPAGKDESDLLVDGDVDALFHAAEPRAFIEGHPKVRRLFADPREVERAYYARTGIFPIMHAVAVRRDLMEQNPELPTLAFNAYVEAKRATYAQMREKWFLRTLPWFAQELASTEDLMGPNFWAYGLDANRKTLDKLFAYAYDQGLAARRLEIDEVFAPSTLKLIDSG